MQDSDLQFSQEIENLLTLRNPRGMQLIQPLLTPGYYLRAARLLLANLGKVLIATGFPIQQTFETDGPVGALALYSALETLGATPILACEPPLSAALAPTLRIHDLSQSADQPVESVMNQLAPDLIVAIERPGLSSDARYYNMRGNDITSNTHDFDRYIHAARCPTIAIGDGGNEIGMGKVLSGPHNLQIQTSVTTCDELLIADVSNWGAYGLIAMIGQLQGVDLLAAISPRKLLQRISDCGGIDGVTGDRTLTEDGMSYEEGEKVVEQLRSLRSFN